MNEHAPNNEQGSDLNELLLEMRNKDILSDMIRSKSIYWENNFYD